MRRGFKLLFSLRDFHLSPSSISSQFSASVHSVESDRVLTSSCCCCIGCVDQLEDNDDHENNKSDQLFVDHPPAYMATGRFHDGSDQQSSQSKALSSQNSSQTIEPEHLCADASQTLRLCHHHQSHYHAPALAPLMEQRCFSDVVFRVRDDRVPGGTSLNGCCKNVSDFLTCFGLLHILYACQIPRLLLQFLLFVAFWVLQYIFLHNMGHYRQFNV